MGYIYFTMHLNVYKISGFLNVSGCQSLQECKWIWCMLALGRCIYKLEAREQKKEADNSPINCWAGTMRLTSHCCGMMLKYLHAHYKLHISFHKFGSLVSHIPRENKLAIECQHPFWKSLPRDDLTLYAHPPYSTCCVAIFWSLAHKIVHENVKLH